MPSPVNIPGVDPKPYKKPKVTPAKPTGVTSAYGPGKIPTASKPTYKLPGQTVPKGTGLPKAPKPILPGKSVAKGVPNSLKPVKKKVEPYNSIYAQPKSGIKPAAPSKPGKKKVEPYNSIYAAPKPAAKPETKAPAPKAEAPKSGGYKVKKGDSLWSIAEKNKPKGTTTDKYFQELKKANPDSQFKSGKRGIIYSGENVNLPKAPKDLAAKLADIRRGGR